MKTKQTQRKKTATVRAKASRVSSRTKATKPLARVKSAKTVVRAKKATNKVRSHAKKTLVPTAANDYRPHLIRAHGLTIVLAIALVAHLTYSFITTGTISVLGRAAEIQTVDLLSNTNKERASAGLGELVINEQLSQAAFLKAQNMFSEQYWAHVSPSGTQPWKWFGDVEYNYSYAGENLAKNYPSAQATVSAWMNSKTHRENILKGEYVDVGFAVVDGELEGKDTTLIVALYGAPVTEVKSVAEGAVFSASAVASESPTPIAYFGSALRVLSPVTVAVLGLFAIVAVVAATAHQYRRQLPKAWRKSWRSHYGLFVIAGMVALGLTVVAVMGSGSI